jgi:gliding motility-associated-like protein
MKRNVLLSFFFFTFFICFQAISQTADITEGCIGMKVQFSAPSSGSWDFGDGKSSGLQFPSNTYTKAGTYVVKFNGSATSITIKVSPKPEIVITATKTKGCVPLGIGFTANLKAPLPQGVTIDNASIVWNYQDGNNSNGTLTPNYTYTTPGVKDLGFYMTFIQNGNTACAKIDTIYSKIISATTKPSLNFTPSATSACVPPLNVTFTNSTSSSLPLTYLWNFGNSNTSTKQNGDPQTYSTNGKFTVTLVATDNNGCSDSLKKIINIGKPKASFYETTKKDTACILNQRNIDLTYFTNKSSPGNYTWQFDAGTSIASSNQSNPGPVSFTTIGNHKVKLTVTTNGCSDDTTVNIFVQDPTINIGISHSYGCRDTLTSFYKITSQSNSGPVAYYSWTFPNFSKSKKGVPSPSNTNTATPKCFFNTHDFTYSVRGVNVDTVYLSYKTTAGCWSNLAHTMDTISEMWARIIPDVHQGCKDLTVTFADSSTSHIKSKIDQWFWDFGDGTKQTLNSKTKPSHTYKTPGIYQASLIIKDNDFNCTDTSWNIEIQVGDTLLPIDFTLSKNSICQGESVQFTNTTDPATTAKISAWNYSSDKEHLSACFQNKDGLFTFNDTVGTHTITLSAEYNGCLVKKSHTLDVKGPIAHFDYLQDCKTPKIIKLVNKAEGAGSVNWNINGTIIPSVSDTTTVDLSTINPPLNYGDVTIKQIASGGVCNADSTTSIVHYGVIKSKFMIEDTLGHVISPTNGKVVVGDASTGQKYVFNAATSEDINPNDCYRGYTFIQEGYRPSEWNLPQDTFLLSKATPSSPDNQIVKMITRNANNCVDTSKITVRIYDLTPNFNASMKSKITNNDTIITSICLPITLSFDGNPSTADTTIKKYEWSFNDNTATSGKIVSHTFNKSTLKNDSIIVTLKITDVNDFVKTKQTIIPIYKPKATITSVPALNPADSTVYICDKDAVTFTGTSAQTLSYTWTYENGTKTFTNVSNSPKFFVKNGQTFSKENVIIDFIETSTGCVGQTVRKINVQKYPTPIIVSNIVNGIGCGNPTFNGNFKDSTFFNPTFNPPCNYVWNLDQNIVTSNASTSLTYPKGNYTINLALTTKSNGCKKDTSISFEVVSPTADFIVNKSDICQGDELTFTMTNPSKDVKTFRWDFGDGVLDSLNSPTKHTYSYVPPSGKTVATLFVQNGSCSNPYTMDINMHYVHADFAITDLGSKQQNDTVTCLGEGFSFTNTSENADVYKWQYDKASSISKDVDSYIFPTVDTFNVHLFVTNNAYGCKDDTIKQVIVAKNPSVIGLIKPVCIGKGAINLATSDTLKNHIYTWSPANNNPIKTTTYTVTVTDTINHCSGINDVLAIVVEDIQPITWDTTIIIGDKIALPIDNQHGTVNFTWTPSDGLSCLQCPKPKAQPLKDIVYTVVMKDNNNCGFSNNGTFNIIVKPETHLKLPTTFTPNGDGVNDVIYVKGWGVKTLETFEIYNRWGELVFKTSNIEEGWDGFFKGELQNNDVYAYKVIGTSWKVDPTTGEDTKMIKEGYIHLMR